MNRAERRLDLVEAADATKGEWFAMNVQPMLVRIASPSPPKAACAC